MTAPDDSGEQADSEDRDESDDHEESDDRMGYRCPSCDEIVQMIMVRGPDESYVVPCGCLIPPRSFA